MLKPKQENTNNPNMALMVGSSIFVHVAVGLMLAPFFRNVFTVIGLDKFSWAQKNIFLVVPLAFAMLGFVAGLAMVYACRWYARSQASR